MSLLSGDLTTLVRVQNWMPNLTSTSTPVINQLISPMTALIYNKLSRARLYSQSFTRYIDGVGNYQILLPDWPVTSITSVQMGAALLNPFPLPTPSPGPPNLPQNSFGYGYRYVPWLGNLPGDPAMLEMVNGYFFSGVQNIKVVYTAGYLIQNEVQTIPSGPGPYTVTVSQPQGIWCRDSGVKYQSSGDTLTPTTTIPPPTGSYNPPADPPATLAAVGEYTFAPGDAGVEVLISYSFIPSDLEEACNQMVAERFSYRDRIGQMDKSLGGQETVRYLRGMLRGQTFNLPPEVEALIWPYVSVIPPAIGAPL